MPGRIAGRHRPDRRPDFYDLRCDDCGATWVGPDGETCWWCIKRHQHLLDEQRELVLTPPEVERDDQSFDTRMAGWMQRLSVAVDAGVITEQEARRAMGKVLG